MYQANLLGIMLLFHMVDLLTCTPSDQHAVALLSKDLYVYVMTISASELRTATCAMRWGFTATCTT